MTGAHETATALTLPYGSVTPAPSVLSIRSPRVRKARMGPRSAAGRAALALTLALTGVMAALGGSARADGTTIASAQADYEPGDTVQLSGSGFL